MKCLAVILTAALLTAFSPAIAADPAAPGASDQMGPAAPAQGALAGSLLRASPSFAGLPEEVIASLAEQALPKLLRSGEAVVAEGETSDSLFLLAAGDFAVLRQGAPAPVARLGAGEIIGEYAVLTGAPRTATVRAVSDSLVFELPSATLAPVMRQYPQLVSAMSALMAERLQRNDPQGPSKDVLAKELEEKARQRLGF